RRAMSSRRGRGKRSHHPGYAGYDLNRITNPTYVRAVAASAKCRILNISRSIRATDRKRSMVAKRARQPELEALPGRRRFSADEYERMVEVDILRDDKRLELWEGDILCMSPIGKRHQSRVAWLNDRFAAATHGRAIVWVQGSFRMHDGAEPQP